MNNRSHMPGIGQIKTALSGVNNSERSAKEKESKPQKVVSSKLNRTKYSQTSFNNQNTIVMSAKHADGYLMLMHDTRIFYFKRDDTINPESDDVASFKDATNDITTIFLGSFNHTFFFYFLGYFLNMLILFKYLMFASLFVF